VHGLPRFSCDCWQATFWNKFALVTGVYFGMDRTPDNWNRAKELFEAALEMEPPQQASFLAEKCEDENLRQQVERLLINFQEAGSFLDDPVLGSKIGTPDSPAKDPELESTRRAAESSGPSATATNIEAEDPMVGRQLGAYKLVRRVGQGGMASVYLAARADDEYRKQVAIKVVHPGLGSHNLLTRLRIERQTLAGLDHPNIVRLLDGGSTPEGFPFLVMDYVEGCPIDDYCDRHGLCVDARLQVFSKVCEAVQYAHQKGVVHRDLKPSNILVAADGTPKLLDFGIAKVLNPEPCSKTSLATRTGMQCMTPAYASPEQMRGKSITAVTDIYSLGVVLYELLSGHCPYRLTQHTPAEIERAICEQDPEPPSSAVNRVETDTSSDGAAITRTPELVSQTREGQPERLHRRLRGDLDNIVLKALQKEPERRYGSAEEFSQDIVRHLQHVPVKARRSTVAYRTAKFLQRHKTEASTTATSVFVLVAALSFAFNVFGLRDRTLGFGSRTRIQSLTTVPQIRSIAVLPLQNLSSDPSQEYFSDGMTDALITELGQIRSLRVISSASVMRYKKTDKSLPDIARELNVEGIIEGGVQRSGENVRIDVQLLYGPSDKHIWANSYDCNTRDILALERDITDEIARQLRARVHVQGSSPARPVDPKALDAYLEGAYHLSRVGHGSIDEELTKATEYFQQAINADPNFAQAYVGLSAAIGSHMRNSVEDATASRKAAERAAELDPTSATAQAALGDFELYYSWDWTGAEEQYRRAVALNPSSTEGHDGLSDVFYAMGRIGEGWSENQIAQELDPIHDHLSQSLLFRRDYGHAIELILRWVQDHPDDGDAYERLSEAYALRGLHEKAIPAVIRWVISDGFPETAARIDRAFSTSGYETAMRVLARELEDLNASKRAFLPGTTASVYALLGDKDRAFYWLEQAYQHREIIGREAGLVFLKVDPCMDSLRSDPRFNDLLRRIGLPP
jgi:serine/threonine protein kinase/tetratricopeptide (TPR) repeat protein